MTALRPLALFLALAGCAGGLPGARAKPTEGLEVAVANRVTSPCTLERARVAVDDKPLAVEIAPAPGDEAARVGSLALAPDAHVLGVVAVVRCPPGRGETEDVVTSLRVVRRFRTQDVSARLAIDLYLGDLSTRRLEARLALSGGRLEEDAGASRSDLAHDDGRCALLGTIDEALCTVRAKLERARLDRDVIRVTCVSDKLAQMRALTSVAQSSGPRSEQSTQEARGPFTPLEAEGKILTLSREADQCIGEDVAMN